MGLGFADDTLLFLKANNLNLANCLKILDLFSTAAGLNLNVQKSALIDISAEDFEHLIWNGKRIPTGHVFRHLGYPIGVDVTNKQLIDWIMIKLKNKINYWKSDEWPLHVRLRIIQSILIPYVMYYLPLLDWKKHHIAGLNSLLNRFYWGGSGAKPIVLISWSKICQPKNIGGLGILNLRSHAYARRATLLHKMFTNSAPWCLCLWTMVKKATVYHHGYWELDDWTKIFSHCPLKIGFRTAQMLIDSWKLCCSLLIWAGRIRYTENSLSDENVHWSFIFKKPPALILGSKSRYFHKKGINDIGQMLDSKGDFMSFFAVRRSFRLGQLYRNAWHLLCTIIYKVQVPHAANLQEDRFRDWASPHVNCNWWTTKTAQFYVMLIEPVPFDIKCNAIWSMHKSNEWWCHKLNSVWTILLDFKFKLFLWRLFSGSLANAALLKEKGFTDGKCVRCKKHETIKHAFWFCCTVHNWCNQLLGHLHDCFGYKFNRFQFTFGTFTIAAEETQILFQFIRCWFLWFIWIIRNKGVFEMQNLYTAGFPKHALTQKITQDALALGDATLRTKILKQIQKM